MVEAVANALAPWYTLLGFLGTLIGLVVYFRKGLRRIAGRAEHAVEEAAHATTQSTHAVNESVKAVDTSIRAVDSSHQAVEAIEFLAGELAKANTKSEYLADEVSTLLGALARERARQFSTDSALPDGLDTGEIEAQTITGRHRLHTQHIQTIDEGDHP
jgi:hypothetical protein